MPREQRLLHLHTDTWAALTKEAVRENVSVEAVIRRLALAASPGARHDVPDLDAAWAEAEAALIAAQGDDDGFGVEIAYWEEFPESPWAVAANDVQVEAARLPEALRNLAAILRPPVLVPRDEPTREDIEG